MSNVLEKLVVEIAADLDGFDRALAGMQGKLKSAGQRMQSVGKGLTIGLTTPIVGMGIAVARMGAGFELAMNRVGALTSATAAELQAMETAARDAGATTKFGAADAADALGFLAMAGLGVRESIDALPATLQLAASAQMDMADAADIVTNVMAGYGMQVEELGRVNDVLVKAFTSSNTNLTQLADAMKYAGPVAKSAGIGFETTAAALGLMGNAGVQASMAGTALRSAISRMLSPTKQVEEAMAELGITFTDASGKLKPFDQIIQELEPHADNTAAMMQIFGQRAGPAMMALLSQGSDALREMVAELENAGGTAQRVADSQMQGLSGAWEEFKSAIEELVLALGQSGFLEALESLLRWAADMVLALSKLDPKILQFGAVLAGLAAAVGPLLLALGLVAAAIAAISAPVLLVVAAIVGAVGLVAAMTIWKDETYRVLAQISDAWQRFKDTVLDFVSRVAERFSDFKELMFQFGQDLAAKIDEIGQYFRAFVDFIVNTWDNARDVFAAAVQDVMTLFQTFLDFLTGNVSPETAQAIAQILLAFGELPTKAVEAVRMLYDGVKQWLGDRFLAALDGVSQKVQEVTGFFRDMYDKVVGHSYVPDMVDGVIAEFSRLDSGMVGQAQTMMDRTTRIFESATSRFSSLLTDSLTSASFNLESFRDWAFSILDDVARAVVQTSISDPISNALGGVLGSIGKGLGGWLGGLFGGGGGSLFGGGGGPIDLLAGSSFRAEGGRVQKGYPYVVGEKRPEVFVPNVDGKIMPSMERLKDLESMFLPEVSPFARGSGQRPGSTTTVVVENKMNVMTGVQQTVRSEIRAMLPEIERRTLSATMTAIQRGGPEARIVGRRK